MSKIFPFTRGGPTKIFLPQSEHVSSQIWCQKFFPFTGEGGAPLTKIFFSSLNMYQAKSGGVKKIFPFTAGGSPLTKIFFSGSEHVSSQIWWSKFFSLYWGGGAPLTKIFFSSLNMYQAKSGCQKIFPFTAGGVPLTKIFFPV